MEGAYETTKGNGPTMNGHISPRQSSFQTFSKGSLCWLDLRVFYVRVSKCEVDDSAPEFLTLNHIPLDPNTLLEVNGVRTSIYSDGASSLLRRDRLDKKSEEATFVSTDSIRMTGSVKFEVFDKDVLLLTGTLELCDQNGFVGEARRGGQYWGMSCESHLPAGAGIFKGKTNTSQNSDAPTMEVYVAGSFSGNPIILTESLHLSSRRKHTKKGGLDSIPEYDANEGLRHAPPRYALQMPDYLNQKPENEDYYNGMYTSTDFMDGEDGELSWFNAGVRVGVGIGLSVCVGIGIGVGLLARTYQGTRNFKRRLL